MAQTIKAIQIKAANDAQISEVSVPKLRDDFLLVRTKAVALNPTDWKHIAWMATPGARVGCDYSGVVLEIGSKVTKDFKVGDRVWGFAHGSNGVQLEDGTFAEIIAVKADLQSKIPDNLSFEEAATLGVGVFTVGQGLYQSLALPLPTSPVPADKKFPILIYGGSTATGALAIQYAKLSGLEVIATSSERNFEYLKSLGADKVFDYNSPTVVEDIRAYTNNSLKYVFDCISEGDSIRISVSSFGPEGGVYAVLLNVDAKAVSAINPNVVSKLTFAYTAIGNRFIVFGKEFPASVEDFEFAKKFAVLSNDLLASKKVKVHSLAVNEFGTGFEGILKGLQFMKEGKVSGKKLVYTF